jgi:hypothetical protein
VIVFGNAKAFGFGKGNVGDGRRHNNDEEEEFSGPLMSLRRVSPDRGAGIIAALPSVNNLIAVGPGDPVGNPLLQPRTKINNLTAVLAGSLI